MTTPKIEEYCRQVGKSEASLTLEDWRAIAIAATQRPAVNKGGRPRTRPQSTVNALLARVKPNEFQLKKRIGRASAKYFGQPIDFYAELINSLPKDKGAPKGIALIKIIVRSMKQITKLGHVDPDTLRRALHRYEVDKNKH